MWAFDYLPKELNLKIYRKPITREINGKKFYLSHGDGLGPGDFGYKFIKAVFASKVCQWFFARIHPNLGIRIAQFWSGKSRKLTEELHFHGEKEWLVIFSREILKKEHFDYFIFGHRHLPIDMVLAPSSSERAGGEARYINLGEWISHFSYAVFDGKDLALKYFRE